MTVMVIITSSIAMYVLIAGFVYSRLAKDFGRVPEDRALVSWLWPVAVAAVTAFIAVRAVFLVPQRIGDWFLRRRVDKRIPKAQVRK